jgi:hypothetical protein
MSETIPDDIIREAKRITAMDWYEGDVSGEIARALLAERLSATERAAEIAESCADDHDAAAFTTDSEKLVGLHRQAERTATRIAAAIRSQP